MLERTLIVACGGTDFHMVRNFCNQQLWRIYHRPRAASKIGASIYRTNVTFLEFLQSEAVALRTKYVLEAKLEQQSG